MYASSTPSRSSGASAKIGPMNGMSFRFGPDPRDRYRHPGKKYGSSCSNATVAAHGSSLPRCASSASWSTYSASGTSARSSPDGSSRPIQ